MRLDTLCHWHSRFIMRVIHHSTSLCGYMRVIGPAAAFGALALDALAAISSAVGSPTVRASSVDVKAAEDYRHHHQLPADAAAAASGITADRRHFAARALDAAKQGNEGGASTKHQHDKASPASMAAAQPARRAYATLLYSDFIEGTRALGQSLRESGTSADTVVLVTPDVRQETREKLAEDGWIVRPVAVEANPNQNFQSRLVFVYTKLLIVEMEEEYDRIVFLDADTLVLENIDELFECEPFCAVMRHSELLNSGVVVITPSKELYGHMHDLMGKLKSYTGGDQGFLNSFYPYFAACPAFEPYPILGSRLAGVGSGVEDISGGGGGERRRALGGDRDLESVLVGGGGGVEDKGGGERQAVAMEGEGGTRRRRLAGEGEEWVRPKGWRCKRLPTRYNGDWPLLFVDGDLQVVQGKEAGPEAPADWKRRKKVKILHYTFGTAKPWNWWTYPFLPYVDLWLEAFHRLDGRKAGSPRLGIGGEKAKKGAGSRTGRDRERRPRWNGVVGQAVHGLAPLIVVGVLWRAAKRWTATRRALRNMCIALARYTIPVKALNARSLSGSVFNLSTGLVLALSAAVLAFKAVPTARLGAARPEAAWAFFWGRATAYVIIAEGSYLVLVSLKAHKVFAASTPRDNALELDATNNGDGGCTTTPMVAPPAGSCPGRRAAGTGAVPQPPGGQASVTTAGGIIGGSGVAEGTGKQGGASVGGMCGPRRLALTETVAHLVFLSAMATSLVSAPLWVGLNGFPASREVVPGIARLLALLVAFTFSAVRLPPLWAAHARLFDCSSSSSSSTKGGSSGGSSGSGGGGGVRAGCGSWKRGRRMSRSNRLEMQAERAALNNLSPLSDHHTA